ncbi:hypothetical protein [Sphingobacterium chungjuense]|uniref:hypothetical protein n=1 Tax=Sphingobacterium chungjuense TaxID=2675553 RepID=UPI001407A385|nr:hypothetical protein [Sphingobacterium chungjuense]
MSYYRSELYNLGVIIYDQEINPELFELLESLYGEEVTDDYFILKSIYSLLSDEVDDTDFYDLGYHEDNDDLVGILYQYCLDYEVDKSLLSLALGAYCIQPDQRHFNSHEAFHQALITALHTSAMIPDDGQHLFTLLRLNEVVDSDLKELNKEVYKNILLGKTTFK